ncbi:beta strand repeat-containing protein, partial [Variovorax sp. JS1663]|uniref:beta strand repeat-containing protein n=1 Tax=Variovorax sp. JS1663 TaxID=1851577 RepID=UPI003FD65ED8
TIEAQSLQITAAGDIDNRGGTLRQTGGAGLTLTATALSNTAGGVIGAEPVPQAPASPGPSTSGPGTGASTGASTGTGTGTSTDSGAGAGTASPSHVPPAPGRITAAGAILNDGGRIYEVGPITLDTPQVNNTGGSLSVANLAVSGPSFSNAGGSLNISQSFSANVDRFDNARGRLQAGSLQIASRGELVNTDGTLIAAGDMALQGASIDLSSSTTSAANIALTATQGHITTSGATVITPGTLSVAANSHAGQTLVNQAGQLQAGQLSLNLSHLANTGGGQIVQTGSADTRISVAGALNNAGTLASNGNTTIAAGSLENNGGTIAAFTGALDVTTMGTTSNVGGSMQAGAATTLRNAGLDNTRGKISGEALSIDTRAQALANAQGTLAATTTVNVQSGALSNDAGLIQSGAAMLVDTHGQQLTNTNATAHSSGQGGISSGDTLSLSTGSVNNTAGFIGAKNALSADTQAFTNTAGGTVLGQSSVAIDTHGARYDNSAGKTQAMGDLSIDAGDIRNAGGLVRSLATATLKAGAIVNANTLGTDQGIEGRNVAITTGTLVNASGAIRADVDATLSSGGRIDNTFGLISAGNTLRITDPNAANPSAKTLDLTNTHGKLVADKSLQIDAATFSADGVMTPGQDLRIALTQDIVNNAEVAANGNLSYTTTGSFTNHGKLAAGQTLTVGGHNVENSANAEMSGRDTLVSASGTLTNRGLIDSKGATQINAGIVDNIGTGRVYGDAISIAAGTLDNQAETVGGVTKAGTIAARDSLDIGADTITNRDGASIFSAGSLFIGGALDAKRYAAGQGATLNNHSATIESLGSMAIAMGQVNNLDTHLQVVPVTTTASKNYLATTDGKIWSHADTWGDPVSRVVYHRAADGSVGVVGIGYADWHVDTRTVTDTAANVDPARIVAGGNLDIQGQLLNRD